MSNAICYLEDKLGLKQDESYDHSLLRGNLQTENYEYFEIRSDIGEILYTFEGAKRANHCLPGDYVIWDRERECCKLELSDEHPQLVGTLHLTQPTRYGFTSRKIPLYLFTPYDERYPSMIVGSSEKDRSCNRLCLVKYEGWEQNSQFPRGSIQRMLGRSGDLEVEKQAIQQQVCPWKYPKISFHPKSHEPENRKRKALSGVSFHIDPSGCRDVDDVISIETIDDKIWRIMITISDVAAYVEENSAEDIMASLISQSIYDLNGKVIHAMLPKEYSEEACSLVPGEWKKGVTMEVLWDGHKISSPLWYESTVKVNHSYTYETFQETKSIYREIIKAISSYLAGYVVEDAHIWVEQLMIKYNSEVGKILKNKGVGILRRHEIGEREYVEHFRNHLPEWKFLAMSSAEYVLAEEKDTYHSGLDCDAYAHATSPIRRYADLVNQRLLKEWIREQNYDPMAVYVGSVIPVSMYDMNRRERSIRQFERDQYFLEAIEKGKVCVKAIIIGKKEIIDNEGKVFYQIQFYVPDWKKRITGCYRKVNDNLVMTKDEADTRDVTDFKEVEVKCSVQWSSRNWKSRLCIQFI